ncbi:MAG: YxeA family protein [Clostridium sp.]|uniref:YxeA family protein n=1 Tax=Clostridium sp. TaxID=1506 RepID=UPI003F2AD36C
MKKILGLICVVVVLRLILGTNMLINFGATKYYVKTNLNYNTNGQVYSYETKGYDKHGNEETLDFNTDKILKPNKFLKIYKSNGKVRSYEEVEANSLPSAIKQIYKVN